MKRAPLLKIATLCTVMISHATWAGSFGIYDPRSQSMGGAAVAVGSVDMAAGHNPALLGLYNEDEDTTLNGRYYLPYALGSLSEVAIDAIDLIDEELDVMFDEALSRYNATPNPANAALVSTAATDLEQGLEGIANRDIAFSAFVAAISISEPSKKGGGAFYLGSRIEGGGASYVPDDDLALFKEYIKALDNVAAGGDWRDVNCDVFNLEPDSSGDIICRNYDSLPPSLRDPLDVIESSARIRGLVINEAAVSAAWGFDMDRMRVAIGVTPKVMQVRVFDEVRNVSDKTVNTSLTFKPHLMFNADIGIAIDFDMGVRLAYVGKDLFTRNFSSGEGNEPIKLNAKHRMGIGYIQPNWQIGLDYDMQVATPYDKEKTGQLLSLGGEYMLFKHLALRAGYRYDTDNNLPAVSSIGIGTHWLRTYLNISYQTSQQERGAGLQLGFAF